MGTRVRQTKEGESQLQCTGPWKGHGEQRRGGGQRKGLGIERREREMKRENEREREREF